jgi:Crinkler effector protein N-terminal domain
LKKVWETPPHKGISTPHAAMSDNNVRVTTMCHDSYYLSFKKGKDVELSPEVPTQTTSVAGPSMTSQQQATTSLGDTFRVLRCLVWGDLTAFKVNVLLDNDVDDLRKLIHLEKDKGILRNINVSDLVLWKVSQS